MTEIVWILDRMFIDSTGNSIQVLQRILPDLGKAKSDELLPFFHEPSLFQISPSATNTPQRIAGTLVKLAFDKGILDVWIKAANSVSVEGEKWSINSINESRMTVWRVNNVLDTIQINIMGEHDLYMQTGGSALIHIFSSELTKLEPNEDVILAEKIFAENALPKNG
jgi:hypothetical protein